MAGSVRSGGVDRLRDSVLAVTLDAVGVVPNEAVCTLGLVLEKLLDRVVSTLTAVSLQLHRSRIAEVEVLLLTIAADPLHLVRSSRHSISKPPYGWNETDEYTIKEPECQPELSNLFKNQPFG